jgi:hypothetical protein
MHVDERFQAAMARFDAANSEDPNTESEGGEAIAKELLYARRMSAWLQRLESDAPEAVRLAARCQHIRRWVRPRGDYPMDRAGYKQWRKDLARFHAETAGGILREVGYDEAMVQKVGDLLIKKGLKRDPDTQLLEDVICLVFLENYFAAFSSAHDDDKIVDIVAKTWKKMSPRGHTAALALRLPPRAQALVARALTR